jgi:hypothetical protein
MEIIQQMTTAQSIIPGRMTMESLKIDLQERCRNPRTAISMASVA